MAVVHSRAGACPLQGFRAPASGPCGGTSLDVLPNGAKPSFDGDVPIPRLGCGVESVTGRVVLDDSHPPLRCTPTMTMQRTPMLYVSGYGESAVPTLSASKRSSIDDDVSERTLQDTQE